MLKHVPHRQWVFSIPKRLRIYFLFDRKLLTRLSRCAWKLLNRYLTQTVAYDDAKAGAAIVVQSFGDFQNFNPLLHVLATDGQVPTLIDSDVSRKEFRQNWTRLIRKIYPVKFPEGNPVEQGKSCRCPVVS